MAFNDFPKTEIAIIGPQGEERGTTKAILQDDFAMIQDTMVVVEAGDEIRRRLPNGRDEAFSVVDASYSQGLGGIPAHYQLKLQKKGQFAPHTGGNFNVTVNGANARVNIGSQDYSSNTTIDDSTFGDLRKTLDGAGLTQGDKAKLEKLIAAMEAAKGKPGFAEAYQKFIAGVGEHVKIIAPFIPLLSKFIGPA